MITICFSDHLTDQTNIDYHRTLWQVHYAHTDARDKVWHAIVPD